MAAISGHSSDDGRPGSFGGRPGFRLEGDVRGIESVRLLFAEQQTVFTPLEVIFRRDFEDVVGHALDFDRDECLLDGALLAIRCGLEVESSFLFLLEQYPATGEDTVLVLFARFDTKDYWLHRCGVECRAREVLVERHKELGLSFLQGDVGSKSGECFDLKSPCVCPAVEDNAFAGVCGF